MENGKIKVVVRVRPKLTHEDGFDTGYLSVQENSIQLSGTPALSGKVQTKYAFDCVLNEKATQEQVYDDAGVDQLISSVLDGYHATIFAYGQTGSGKTFTMDGYEYESVKKKKSQGRENPTPNLNTDDKRLGLVPRAVRGVFEAIAKLNQEKVVEIKVKCSFLQIYNEQIYDLLNPSHLRPNTTEAGTMGANKMTKGLRLRWTANTEFYVENAYITACRTHKEVLEYFHAGIKNKVMASHQLNAASSRSHSIFTIYIEGSDPSKTSKIVTSKLTLVDLAGSERVSKTGATGTTLQESIGINKSLSVLRQVVQALSEPGNLKNHIPYRDAKLTSILKHSLGGNSITVMIACLSPCDCFLDENLSTLTYAAKASNISNTPVKNEDPKNKLIRTLRAEVIALKDELLKAQELVLSLDSTKIPDKEVTQQALDAVAQKANSSESNSSTENALNPKINAGKMTTATNEDDKSLQQNVKLIKQLYITEQNLRTTLAQTSSTNEDLKQDNYQLNNENQSLRERIEVLEYLVASSENTNEPETIESDGHIPGYGKVSISQPLQLEAPAKSRIHAVLRDAQRRQSEPIKFEKPRLAPKNNHLNISEEPMPPSTKRVGQTQKKPRRRGSKSRDLSGSLTLADLQSLLKQVPEVKNGRSSFNK